MSFCAKLFRRKPITKDVAADSKLIRVLGLLDIIGFGCASAVGSGVFVISGEAGKYAGPSLFISFIIGGISCLFCGLCYGEFATRIPVSGSAYTFSYAAMGEIIGFIIGWNLTLEYGISASVVAQSWSSYLEAFIKNVVSSYDENSTVNEIFFGKNLDDVFTINILSLCLILAITLMLMNGIRQSATFTNFITVWNILLILTFIVAGCFYVDTNNWTKPCDGNQYDSGGCTGDQKNSFFGEGLGGILHATGLVFFSYIGFDSVTTLAEETKNPKRDMVWGLIGTLAIATTLYVAVSLVLTGMVPYTALDEDSPLSDAFSKHNATFMSSLVSFGALTTTTATTVACLVGQPRIFYRMAMDGLFYKMFENIKISIVISGILCGIIGCFINFNFLAEMISVGTLLAYVLVCSGVLILRYEPNMESAKNISVLVCLYVVFCLMFSFALLILIVNQDIQVNDIISYIIIGLLGVILLILVSMITVIHFKYGEVDINVVGDIYLTPLLPFVPLAGIFVNCFMIAALEIASFIRIIIWTIVGLFIYFTYGIKHSKLNNDESEGQTYNQAFLAKDTSVDLRHNVQSNDDTHEFDSQ